MLTFATQHYTLSTAEADMTVISFASIWGNTTGQHMIYSVILLYESNTNEIMSGSYSYFNVVALEDNKAMGNNTMYPTMPIFYLFFTNPSI